MQWPGLAKQSHKVVSIWLCTFLRISNIFVGAMDLLHVLCSWYAAAIDSLPSYPLFHIIIIIIMYICA